MRRNQFVGVAGSVVALTDTANRPETAVLVRTSTRGRGVQTPGVIVNVGTDVGDSVGVCVAVGIGLCVSVTVGDAVLVAVLVIEGVTLGAGDVGVCVTVGVSWSLGTGGYTAIPYGIVPTGWKVDTSA
jgi:hypothetical protein